MTIVFREAVWTVCEGLDLAGYISCRVCLDDEWEFDVLRKAISHFELTGIGKYCIDLITYAFFYAAKVLRPLERAWRSLKCQARRSIMRSMATGQCCCVLAARTAAVRSGADSLRH